MTQTAPLFGEFFQVSNPKCQELFSNFAVDLESLLETIEHIKQAKSPRIASAILHTLSMELGYSKFYYPNENFMNAEDMDAAQEYLVRHLNIFYWHRVFDLFDIQSLSAETKLLHSDCVIDNYTYAYSDKPLTPFTPQNVEKLLLHVAAIYSPENLQKSFSEIKDFLKIKTFKNQTMEISLNYPYYKQSPVNTAMNHLCYFLLISGNPEWHKTKLTRNFFEDNNLVTIGLIRIKYQSTGEKLKLSKPMAAAFQSIYDQFAESV